MTLENPPFLGPEFYDRQYFDPDPEKPPVSNYHRYKDGSRARLVLTALHVLWETAGPRAFWNKIDVIDLGGAKGLMASSLQLMLSKANVVNTDWSHYATSHAFERVKPRTIKCDLRQLPVPDERFDLALCVDVLEHLSEDTVPDALKEIRRIMKLGAKGFLIPNVGEDALTSVDRSHVTIKPLEWWRSQILSSGLVISESLTVRVARILGDYSIFKGFPTIRPGLFIVSKN